MRKIEIIDLTEYALRVLTVKLRFGGKLRIADAAKLQPELLSSFLSGDQELSNPL